MYLFLRKKFFDATVLKVFIEFVTILLLFYILVMAEGAGPLREGGAC